MGKLDKEIAFLKKKLENQRTVISLLASDVSHLSAVIHKMKLDEKTLRDSLSHARSKVPRISRMAFYAGVRSIDTSANFASDASKEKLFQQWLLSE